MLQSVSCIPRLPTGKQEKWALRCWMKFLQLICTAPQHYLSPIVNPPPRAVCYQFILCECSVSPPSHMLSSNNDEWNRFPYGKQFFHLVTKISCLIRANEGWVCHPLLFFFFFLSFLKVNPPVETKRKAVPLGSKSWSHCAYWEWLV